MDFSKFFQQILAYLLSFLVSIGLLPTSIINNNNNNTVSCPDGFTGANCEIGNFNIIFTQKSVL